MIKRRKYGASHTPNILKGLSKEIYGLKVTREVIKDLIQSGWLIQQKKTGEWHYSLNAEKAKEIMEFLEGG